MGSLGSALTLHRFMIYVPFHLNVGAEYLPLSYDARMMLEETVNRKSDAEKTAFYACDN
jgi:hypothetical protein